MSITLPPAGPSALGAALAADSAADTPTRYTWDTLQGAYPLAAMDLTRTLPGTLHARGDVAAALRPTVAQVSYDRARTLLEEVHRALINSPLTLHALARGHAEAHPDEHARLRWPVARRMTTWGARADSTAVDTALTAVLAALGRALARGPRTTRPRW